MNVAVPLPKHSGRFGQAASSQTVCSLCVRNILLRCKTSLVLGDFPLNQGGVDLFGWLAVSTTTGIVLILSAPLFFLSVASSENTVLAKDIISLVLVKLFAFVMQYTGQSYCNALYAAFYCYYGIIRTLQACQDCLFDELCNRCRTPVNN